MNMLPDTTRTHTIGSLFECWQRELVEDKKVLYQPLWDGQKVPECGEEWMEIKRRKAKGEDNELWKNIQKELFWFLSF